MANETQKKLDVNELIERGKAKGSLSNSEILEVMEYCDIEQMEKIYEQIESNGIEITGFDTVDLEDLDDIAAEDEEIEEIEEEIVEEVEEELLEDEEEVCDEEEETEAE